MNDNDSGWPGADLSDSIGFLLVWTAAASERQYAAALAEVKLKPIHVGVLQLLGDGPMVQARLSEQLRVFKPAMVAIINELSAMGLVERRPCPSDRRAVEVHALPEGRRRFQAALRVSEKFTEEFFGVLSSAERASLHQMMRRLARLPSGHGDDTERGVR